MIIKHIDDIKKTKFAVDFGMGKSFRFLTKDDHMGFTLTDTYINANSEYEIQYQNHIEACYIIEGMGEITYETTTQKLEPGVMYALNNHDKHIIRSFSPIRMICVFSPSLEGTERHNFTSDSPSGYS